MIQKVAIVILNYQLKDLCLKCIDSVKRSSYKNIQIFLVDNNSGDDIEQNVLGLAGVIFIKNHQNLGYAGGNNIGIKKALKFGAELILVLNPDTTVDKDAIKNLVEGIDQYNAGAVCPKILFADKKTIWYAGKSLDKLNVLGRHIGVDEKDRGQYDTDYETEANGAAVLIKREVFESVGFFDERFFLYLEDTDFSIRVKMAGFKIMYIHSAKVFHKVGQSTGLGSPLQDYFFTRNRMLFASKHLSFRTQFALIREAIRNFNNPQRRLALIDFLMGKFGKGSFLK